MVTIKKLTLKTAVIITGIFGVILMGGCTPPGERAFLRGEKLLRDGKYEEAALRLKVAVEHLPHNARAWNHFGLALHHSGRPNEALLAYQKAIVEDRNLAPARFNLAQLYFDQHNYTAAAELFATFTVLEPRSYDGWFQLGAAHLRAAAGRDGPDQLRELDLARSSFETAIEIKSTPDALNSLGLAHARRNRAREAARMFEDALRQDPDNAPALLNLAIVHHQQLKDPVTALQHYRDYLALQPQPPNALEVEMIVRRIEFELNPPAPVAAPAQKPAPTAIVQATPPPVTAKPVEPAAPKEVATKPPTASPPAAPRQEKPAPPAAPSVAPEPKPVAKVAAPDPPSITIAEAPKPSPEAVPVPESQPAPPPPPPVPAEPPADEAPVVAADERPSTLQRLNPRGWFAQRDKPVTPLGDPPRQPAQPAQPAVAPRAATPPAPSAVTPLPPRPPQKRYSYIAPLRPPDGDRRQAMEFFAKALEAHRAGNLTGAVSDYRQATATDPGFFEAWHNLGLAAYDAGDVATSLAAYEHALSLSPAALNTRYNFAMALQKGNYPQDAANELEGLLRQYPGETRAHLSLANLYAQHLYRKALARQHYVRVLESEPRHAQAAAIRSWLAANPLNQ